MKKTNRLKFNSGYFNSYKTAKNRYTSGTYFTIFTDEKNGLRLKI